MGDVFGDNFRPAFDGVEGDDADRVLVLAGQQVLNDGLEISSLAIGLAPGAAAFPEIVGHQKDRLVVAVGYDRRRPIGLTHQSNSYATEPGFKRFAVDSFRSVGTINHGRI
jgi:hypothetical protein